MIISTVYLYWLAGALLLFTALLVASDKDHPRRGWSALFWADLGLLFMVGDKMPAAVVGYQVLGLTAIATLGGLKKGPTRRLDAAVRMASALRLRAKLLLPLLTIPVLTMVGSVVFKNTRIGSLYLLDPKSQTVAALGVACVLALLYACWLTCDTPVQAMRQSRELTDAIGWTLVLPQMLGMLGTIFVHAGVGDSVAYLAKTYLTIELRWVVVAVYCAGMMLFAMITGGGGASFPLMASGIGVPILIGVFHGNPAVIAALGMFAAYCGTLVTPMAAHFNLIPAALLELPDKYAVIRAQAPTALAILVVNAVLLYCLM